MFHDVPCFRNEALYLQKAIHLYSNCLYMRTIFYSLLSFFFLNTCVAQDTTQVRKIAVGEKQVKMLSTCYIP